jgi:hypothetical protein
MERDVFWRHAQRFALRNMHRCIAAHPEGKGRCCKFIGHPGRHELPPESWKPVGIQFDEEPR